MPLQTLSGTATNVTGGSQLAYAPTAQYGPVAIQQHLVNFRLNGRPVRMKVTDSASISEGDELATRRIPISRNASGIAIAIPTIPKISGPEYGL